LAFHPQDPTILLSGSTDGLVNIYDTKIQDQDEVIIQTFNHDASIHHAGFMCNTNVFALSHDERFAVYSTAEDVEKGSALANFGDLREPLGSRYVANVFPKTDGSGAIVAAGCQEYVASLTIRYNLPSFLSNNISSRQQFTLVHLSKAGSEWVFDPESAVILPGGHGEEVVRTCCFYDEDQVIFTGGEDGNIRAWRPGT
jgi:WD40 repeat protein